MQQHGLLGQCQLCIKCHVHNVHCQQHIYHESSILVTLLQFLEEEKFDILLPTLKLDKTNKKKQTTFFIVHCATNIQILIKPPFEHNNTQHVINLCGFRHYSKSN